MRMRPAPFLLLVLIGLLILGLPLIMDFVGLVLVIDHTGRALSAALIYGPTQRDPLKRLPGSIFWGIVNADGVVEVRCANGRTLNRDYVTRNAGTRVYLRNGSSC